jgi:hypothetical protein
MKGCDHTEGSGPALNYTYEGEPQVNEFCRLIVYFRH